MTIYYNQHLGSAITGILLALSAVATFVAGILAGFFADRNGRKPVMVLDVYKRQVYNAPTGKVGWALKREYAEVGAKALAGADFPEVLELSGKILTYAELAQALKAVSDKEFRCV